MSPIWVWGGGRAGGVTAAVSAVSALSGPPAPRDQAVASRWAWSLRRWCTVQARDHSVLTLSMPRRRNWRSPCRSLTCPNTGSTVRPRRAYSALPCRVRSLAWARAVAGRRIIGLGPAGSSPGAPGSSPIRGARSGAALVADKWRQQMHAAGLARGERGLVGVAGVGAHGVSGLVDPGGGQLGD